MKVKQKDILNILSPYSMEIVTPGNRLKVVRVDKFLLYCIETYKKSVKAVNIKYIVECE